MTTTLASERVATVLERLHAKARIEDLHVKQRVQAREAELGVRLAPPQRYELYGDAPLAIAPEVGELYYLLTTTRRASRIVEFGASHGISTIYLACALRDLDGSRTLITTEILPAKAEATHRNLADAGLDGLVGIRTGDARYTLRDLDDPVDILVLDGPTTSTSRSSNSSSRSWPATHLSSPTSTKTTRTCRHTSNTSANPAVATTR